MRTSLSGSLFQPRELPVGLFWNPLGSTVQPPRTRVSRCNTSFLRLSGFTIATTLRQPQVGLSRWCSSLRKKGAGAPGFGGAGGQYAVEPVTAAFPQKHNS